MDSYAINNLFGVCTSMAKMEEMAEELAEKMAQDFEDKMAPVMENLAAADAMFENLDGELCCVFGHLRQAKHPKLPTNCNVLSHAALFLLTM